MSSKLLLCYVVFEKEDTILYLGFCTLIFLIKFYAIDKNCYHKFLNLNNCLVFAAIFLNSLQNQAWNDITSVGLNVVGPQVSLRSSPSFTSQLTAF